MSKSYTRTHHAQIGRYQRIHPVLGTPTPVCEVWAVCAAHALHLMRHTTRGRIKLNEVVCEEIVTLERPLPYKQARDMCLLFNVAQGKGGSDASSTDTQRQKPA